MRTLLALCVAGVLPALATAADDPKVNPRLLPLRLRQVDLKRPNRVGDILKGYVSKVGDGQFEAGAQLFPHRA